MSSGLFIPNSSIFSGILTHFHINLSNFFPRHRHFVYSSNINNCIIAHIKGKFCFIIDL